MKIGQYILSLDQGTTSSRAVLFDALGGIAGMGQREFTQIYPQPGYVEHDAVEILQTQLYAMRQAVHEAEITAEDIAAISITNQRETTVAWDSETGIPICNAIVWQCRRTAPECERLKAEGLEEYIHKTTGLIIDPYFSGTKMKWILDNVPKAKVLAKEHRLRFGTIDTWLIYSLTEGESYVTDVTNASRTMLFDIQKLDWDEKMLNVFGIPRDALPKVVDSSGVVGMCSETILGRKIPIAGIAGDQHAALFGQCCFDKGMAKNTYGTGCFVLMNTGDKPLFSDRGLITTIGWCVNGETTYALEGSAFNAGSAIKWLRDELKLIANPQEADLLAETVEDAGGAVFVPAFTGLGAPYWDAYARGAILGLTRGTTREHIVRATVESLAYETYDVLKAMESDSGISLKQLRVDGGASANNFLMQFQADLLSGEIIRPVVTETTALGAAYLAGLAVGYYDDIEEIKSNWSVERAFTSEIDEEMRRMRLSGWETAVKRVLL